MGRIQILDLKSYHPKCTLNFQQEQKLESRLFSTIGKTLLMNYRFSKPDKLVLILVLHRANNQHKWRKLPHQEKIGMPKILELHLSSSCLCYVWILRSIHQQLQVHLLSGKSHWLSCSFGRDLTHLEEYQPPFLMKYLLLNSHHHHHHHHHQPRHWCSPGELKQIK